MDYVIRRNGGTSYIDIMSKINNTAGRIKIRLQRSLCWDHRFLLHSDFGDQFQFVRLLADLSNRFA